MISEETTNETPIMMTTLQESGGGVPMEKIIVAIHGIGSQLRSSTIRSVARRFGARSQPPLPVMPLGYFNIAKGSKVRWSRLDADPNDDLAKIGFAEIYWADIPDQVVKANDTLEETKAWGRTVVSRAESAYMKAVPNGHIESEDFALGIGVVDEIIETIGVLENLLSVAEKAGVFKFEIGELLRDYIDDVQIVTDFPYYREEILYRFHSALAAIVATFKETYPNNKRPPEIYIVAHSEGTVISLLGLLQALSGHKISDRENPGANVDESWVTFVHGFMTIGSPIDKHIALWPKLWDGFEMKAPVTLPQQIKWRNYFDFGDPIGFRLDAAVKLLRSKNCDAFQFVTAKHDFGFSRSWLPGKAHNDYWDDTDVFGHFIEDVVFETGKAKPPANRRIVGLVSKIIPYTLTFLLHLAAVFVLYKAIIFTPESGPKPWIASSAQSMGLLGGLLLSITVAARLPRLVKPDQPRWKIASLAALLAGAICVSFLPEDVANFLGGMLPSLPFALYRGDESAGKTSLIFAAFLVAFIAGWAVPRKPKWSRRTLLGTGVFVIGFIVIARLAGKVSAPPVWPVMLAGLLFLYLWWLGILLFDLTFVWHRYIREAVFVQALRSWCHGEDGKPRSLMGLGPDESELENGIAKAASGDTAARQR